MGHIGIKATDDRSGAELARLEPRIAANADPVMRFLHRLHQCRNCPLANAALHGQACHRHSTRQTVAQPFKHRLQDRRHAGKDMYVLNNETGGCTQRIVDQCRTFRDVRHLLPGRVEFDVRIRVMRNQARFGFGVPDDLAAKGSGDAFSGDIIMRRANAAAGEHQINRV